MSAQAPAPLSFALVARRVQIRVWLRRWLAWLAKSVAAVSALMLVLLIWAAISLNPSALMGGLVVLGLWLLGSAAMAAWKMPSSFSAIALWDDQAGRREAFATASWFELQPTRSVAEQTHLEAQLQALPQALKTLSKDLPLKLWKRFLELPFLAVAILYGLSFWSAQEKEVILDAAMEQIAKTEAEKLAKTALDKKPLAGLTEEEQKALNQLNENLKATAEGLENAQGKEARSVLSELEKRAREAEKLAQKLGADRDAWASQSLIEALRGQADTADLGDAVAGKQALQAAKAADDLAQALQSPKVEEKIRERLNETLKEAQKQSEKEDRQRMVGQHVLAAADQLQQGQPQPAGAEFDKLADKLRDQAQREQARKELEKLAQQLRDAGSNIAGQNQKGGMQQMSAAGQQPAGQAGETPQVGQAQAGQNPSALQPPGLGQMGQGQPMQMTPPNSGQGEGQPQQMMLSQGQVGQPGQAGEKGQGQPMLMAPVPGQKAGDKPEMLLLGPPGDSPEGGAAIAITIPGGKDPGVGKAELKADATAQQTTDQQAVVNAQQGNDGQSSVRAVEGGVRQENAGRSATQTAAEFIQAQEEALDESALPPSRREQVRRYFTELRKRFEQRP